MYERGTQIQCKFAKKIWSVRSCPASPDYHQLTADVIHSVCSSINQPPSPHYHCIA